MDRTLQALEFNLLVEALIRLGESQPGCERLASIRPSRDLGWVKKELRRVEEVRGLIDRGSSFPGGGLRDIRALLRRASVVDSIATSEGLLAVLLHLRVHATTRKILDREREKMPLTVKLASALEPVPELEQQLDRALTPEATIRNGASPELARIRRQVTVHQEQLRERLAALVQRLARQGVLREESFTVREGRYVLPVRSDALRKVRGIIHDRSATGGTLFVEPTALIDLGNELRALELAERDEVRRILRELTGRVRDRLDTIEANLRVMTELDCLWAKARLAQELDACPPKVSGEGPVRILGGRHPLMILAHEREVVPLELELGVDWTTLVISGPNAGGKSVALKCVGLLCLMAACGLHIPALPGTEIPLFDDIQADIGDQQSISDDLSTFTAHAARLKEILAAAGARTLVLIDEIGAGTDPQEGSSLSIAALEQLTQSGTPTIVTTHHGSLKAFAHSAEGCANGSMEFDLETFHPTYRFRPNLPGSSYALEIAHRSGLSDSLITRAKELLGSDRTGLEELIASLSEKVRRYDALLSDTQRHSTVQSEREETYQRKLERLKTREKDLKRRALQEAEEVLKRARAAIEATVKEIREHNADRDSIRSAHQTLSNFREEIAAELGGPPPEGEPPQPPSHEPEPDKLPDKEPDVGDYVTVDSTSTVGEVTAVSARGDRVCVAVGSVQLWVTRNRVVVVSPPDDETPSYHYVKLPEVPFELDIRGLDAQEALQRVERYLHDGFAAGRGKLGIIHGKGSGVLARHVRKRLKGHSLVAEFRFGEYGEGDYGITIVELRKGDEQDHIPG